MKISYRYDALDRLVEVAWADGRRVVYVYDAAGNRLSVDHLSADQSQPATVISRPAEGQSRPAEGQSQPAEGLASPAAQPAQVACPNCGAWLSPAAKFCKQCGARQGDSTAS